MISGDRHMASIAQKDLRGVGTLFDITSSGINKAVGPAKVLKDASYMVDPYGAVNFGLIRIDWSSHIAHVEIKSLENEKVQGLDIKF